MKAIHRLSKGEYKLSHILGESVTLISAETGNLKRIPYTTFKRQYKMVEGDVEEVQNLNQEQEAQNAQNMAKEVLKESNSYDKDQIRIKLAPERSSKASKIKKTRVTIPKGDKASKGANKSLEPISLKTLCKEIQIDPGKARRLLRKHEIDKPEGSWEWTDQIIVGKIRMILKGSL